MATVRKNFVDAIASELERSVKVLVKNECMRNYEAQLEVIKQAHLEQFEELLKKEIEKYSLNGVNTIADLSKLQEEVNVHIEWAQKRDG